MALGLHTAVMGSRSMAIPAGIRCIRVDLFSSNFTSCCITVPLTRYIDDRAQPKISVGEIRISNILALGPLFDIVVLL